MTALSSAGGWDTLWGQLWLSTPRVNQLQPSSPLPGQGMLQHPKGLSLPLEWSGYFSLPLTRKERNTLFSLTFAPF